jgi:hypothetical protein
MRRIAVYRDGSQMAPQIGPDWVHGVAGFGATVPDALRDLAHAFADHGYELRGDAAGIEAAGEFIQVKGSPGQSPADVLLTLAGIIEERGFQEQDFPEPDWDWLANEERVVARGDRRN